MNTTPATIPTSYAVLNGADEVIETADTQTEAFRIIDWYSRHEAHSGPYRAVLRIPEQRLPL
jgi:hypothetical protein